MGSTRRATAVLAMFALISVGRAVIDDVVDRAVMRREKRETQTERGREKKRERERPDEPVVDGEVQTKSGKTSSQNATQMLRELFANKTESPNMLDVMAMVPHQEEQYIAFSSRNSLQVAVCSVGHLRTFGLPGVYSGLKSNLLDTAPNGGADLFLIGHLGIYEDTHENPHSVPGPRSESDEKLQQAIKYVKSSMVKKEFGTGDCSALQAAWARDGVTNRSCGPNVNNRCPPAQGPCKTIREDRNFMQIMWLDHCIRQVRKSGKKYDLIVRTRPDIGVFEHIPWGDVDSNRISYMKLKDGERRRDGLQQSNDFFFTMPVSFADTWWDHVVQMYVGMHRGGRSNTPEDIIWKGPWNFEESLKEVNFPVAIVRGPTSVDCGRITGNSSLRQDCIEKAKGNYFANDQIGSQKGS